MYRQYFAPVKLLLEQQPDGLYHLTVGGQEIGIFKSKRKAETEYLRLRAHAEAQFPSRMPPTEDKKKLFEEFLRDSLVASNTFYPRKKPPNKTRTFRR